MRAAFAAVTRRATPDGAGHKAVSPPMKTISAPSQIQVTSGEIRIRKVAGGAVFG